MWPVRRHASTAYSPGRPTGHGGACQVLACSSKVPEVNRASRYAPTSFLCVVFSVQHLAASYLLGPYAGGRDPRRSQARWRIAGQRHATSTCRLIEERYSSELAGSNLGPGPARLSVWAEPGQRSMEPRKKRICWTEDGWASHRELAWQFLYFFRIFHRTLY